MKTYQAIARKIAAISNCERLKNTEWLGRHLSILREIVKKDAPSGSGIDCGTEIDEENSTQDKLIFTFSYHHMNDGGMYDGWTEHKAIVTPSLLFGFSLKITGRDRNAIKEYLHEVYSTWLEGEIDS